MTEEIPEIVVTLRMFLDPIDVESSITAHYGRSLAEAVAEAARGCLGPISSVTWTEPRRCDCVLLCPHYTAETHSLSDENDS